MQINISRKIFIAGILAMILVTGIVYAVEYYWNRPLTKQIVVEGTIDAGMFDYTGEGAVDYPNYMNKVESYALNAENKMTFALYNHNVDFGYIRISVTGAEGLITTVQGDYGIAFEREGNQMIDINKSPAFPIALDTDVSIDYAKMLWNPQVFEAGYEYTIEDANCLVLLFSFNTSTLPQGTYDLTVTIELGGI